MTRCQINNPEDCFGPCPCGERNVAHAAPVAAQPAASGVEALWVRGALQELAHRIKHEGLDIFDGPETPQMVRDAIEWFAAELSVSDLSTALTGAAKEVK